MWDEWEMWEDRTCLPPSLTARGEHPVNTAPSPVYWGLLSQGVKLWWKKDGPWSYRVFVRCLAFTPSHWRCFTLSGWLNIHWARERRAGDWVYCPVVQVLTWDVRDAGSSPCSKDDLIIHTKWSSSSKEDVHASKTDGPLLCCTKPLPF